MNLSDEERDRRVMYLKDLVDDAMWFLKNKAVTTTKRAPGNLIASVIELGPKKQRLSDEDED